MTENYSAKRKCIGMYGKPLENIRVLGVLFLIALLVSSCVKTIEMKEIDPAEIPDEIKESIENDRRPYGGKEIKNITWRVCEERDGYLFVACEIRLKEKAFGSEDHFIYMEHRRIQEDNLRRPGGSVLIGYPKASLLFYGGAGANSYGNPDGTITYELEARGMALDSRVAKIVGTTSAGRTVETTPINGFWWLIIENTRPNERWTSVKALDDKGKVLHQFRKNQL